MFVVQTYCLLQIGIAPVDYFYDFFVNKSFVIDVYDGPSADSPTLLYWHGRKTYAQQFSSAKTSTGSVIFVNYTAPGGSLHLHVKLIYYLCGGQIKSDMYIRSPIFNTSNSFHVPFYLECTWSFEKPSDVLFGHLHFLSVRLPYCGALHVKSRRGILVTILRSNTSDIQYIDSRGSLFSKERNEILRPKNPSNAKSAFPILKKTVSLETKTSDQETSTVKEMSICNSSVNGIAFNGSSLNLTFNIIFPEEMFSVRARYSFLRPLKLTSQKNKSKSDWFKNYAAIIFFLPIGLVIGLLIICVQMQSWKHLHETTWFKHNAKNNCSYNKKKLPAPQEMLLLNTTKNRPDEVEPIKQDKKFLVSKDYSSLLQSAKQSGFSSSLQNKSRYDSSCENSSKIVSDIVIHCNPEKDHEDHMLIQDSNRPKVEEKLDPKKVTFMIGN